MYNQLVQPNLSVVGVPEECLVYVREVFGAAAKYPTAIAAWDAATYKFAGQQPPSGVAVPIWFSYSGPDGHVAVWDNGKIYSTTAQGDKTFSSIQELIDFMGEDFEYLGWSEDVDGVRVVQPAPAPAPSPAPTGQTIFLPPTTGPWHLYKVGGPYNPAVPADVKGIIKPSAFPGGLTYDIVAERGNGVYTINSEDYGEGDLWTQGSDVVIS